MIQLGLYSYNLRSLYRAANVSEQAVSQMRKKRHRRIERILLINQLIVEYKRSHPGCGLTKMYYQINPPDLGRDRFIELAKSLGFLRPKVFHNQRTTIPGSIKWPNLIEGMMIHNKNQVWQTDITYFTIVNTHFYLIFIIDVYTKRIIEHAVSETMHAIHNVRCLKRAIKKRKIKKSSGLIHHSDRGSQFTSLDYINTLLKYGIHKSMGLKGPANAYAERVNGTIKNEYLHYRKIKSYRDLILWVNQAVTHYNHIRIHNALPFKMTPMEFENYIVNLKYKQRPKATIYADANCSIRHEYDLSKYFPNKETKAHICPLNWSN